MKRPPIPSLTATLALLVVAAGLAGASHVIGHAAPDEDVQELLSGIDYVPSRGNLDDVLTDPNADLAAIALDEQLDSGLRLRAIRALGHYPGNDSETALGTLLDDLGDADSGSATLLLRAAIYAIAEVDPAGAVGELVPLLSHPRRDVRADTALALAQTGQVGAIGPLRLQLEEEMAGGSPQVIWALQEAIRSLQE